MSDFVVVTGAASGIGLEIVRVLVQQEYSVVAVDLSEHAEQVDDRLSWVAGDVSHRATWNSVALALQRMKVSTLAGVVHCAASQPLASALSVTAEVCSQAFAVNVVPIFLALQELNEWHREGSAVVNVGSVHALASGPGFALYAASKGAVSALTRALAVELAPRGVRVNAVLPGAVNTPMLKKGLSTEGCDPDVAYEQCARRQVLGRIGDPREIAQAVLFLLDPRRSSYITGAELVVDGGGMAALSTIVRE